jgi:hypothetical protein
LETAENAQTVARIKEAVIQPMRKTLSIRTIKKQVRLPAKIVAVQAGGILIKPVKAVQNSASNLKNVVNAAKRAAAAAKNKLA